MGQRAPDRYDWDKHGAGGTKWWQRRRLPRDIRKTLKKMDKDWEAGLPEKIDEWIKEEKEKRP